MVIRGATATYQCANKDCNKPFTARTADRNRGWARFCSKSCKAIKQTQNSGGKRMLPRPNGITPMKYKICGRCGQSAVNGVREADGSIDWYCLDHEYEATLHPFSSEALGQW